jgi:hypothetical protein
LSDLALDKIGISNERSRLTRALLKSAVAAASRVLLDEILVGTDPKRRSTVAEHDST